MDNPDLDAPIEVPSDVTHRDLYEMTVRLSRRVRHLENGVPIKLSPFQKWVAGVFLGVCGFIALQTWNNANTNADLAATVRETSVDRYTGAQGRSDWRAQAIKDAEQDGRLDELEKFHPRQIARRAQQEDDQ